MDRAGWEKWRDAPAGSKRKRALCAKLLADNDRLAQYYVASFSKWSAYYTSNMQDDLLQAARIGIIRALPAWNPDKGGFSAVGYWWARHEMQLVARHASRISVPKSAFLPAKKQEEMARFESRHGRAPTPEEVGLTEQVIDRSRKAMVEIVDVREADEVAEEPGDSPEAAIDRRRDLESLKAFIGRLSKKDQRDFWKGDRPDLTGRAKRFVEGRRGAGRLA